MTQPVLEMSLHGKPVLTLVTGGRKVHPARENRGETGDRTSVRGLETGTRRVPARAVARGTSSPRWSTEPSAGHGSRDVRRRRGEARAKRQRRHDLGDTGTRIRRRRHVPLSARRRDECGRNASDRRRSARHKGDQTRDPDRDHADAQRGKGTLGRTGSPTAGVERGPSQAGAFTSTGGPGAGTGRARNGSAPTSGSTRTERRFQPRQRSKWSVFGRCGTSGYGPRTPAR